MAGGRRSDSTAVIPFDPELLRQLGNLRLVGADRPTNRGVMSRVRSLFTGNGWFNPGVPVELVAPEGMEPREYDYQTGVNLQFAPRSDAAVQFPTLREMSRQTTTRLAIETRKNQLDRFDWTIKPKDADADKDAAKRDPRIKEVTERLRKPDRRLPWKTWLRKIVEDLFVLDAPAIFIRRTLDGKGVAGLEPIDGATIRPLLDFTGRTPEAGPAFRQVLKGVPAVDFTAQELVYCPRNPCTHSPYGFGPVEQILLTINVAYRREISQLEYFTAGSIPDAIVKVPADWTDRQIARFEKWWYAKFKFQNTEQKRRLHFIPPGDVHEFKDKPLNDEFDEWLARVISWAFDLAPTWAVKLQNRATAETAVDTATDEGLIPLMLWIKDLVDYCIEVGWGYSDLGFFWQDVRDPDPMIQAQTNEIYVRSGVKSVDEVRNELGLAPVGMPHAIMTASGPVLLEDIIHGRFKLLGTTPYEAPALLDDPAAADATKDGAAKPGDPAAPAATTERPTGELATDDPAAAAAAASAMPDGPAVPPGEDVQASVLNGAQITALQSIVAAVNNDEFDKEAGIALIIAAFPSISRELAEGLLHGAEERQAEAAKRSEEAAAAFAENGAVDGDGKPVKPKGDDEPPDDDGNDDPKGGGGGAPPAAPGGGSPPPPPVAKAMPGDQLAKGRRTLSSLTPAQRKMLAGRQRGARFATRAQVTLGRKVHAALVKTRDRMLIELGDRLEKALAPGALQKANAAEAAAWFEGIELAELEALRPVLASTFATTATASAEQGAKVVRLLVPDAEAFALPTDRIVTIAEKRAAELVGKRVLADGTVIDSPNPRIAITQTTREAIRADITTMFEEGWTREQLSERLTTEYAFSEARADLIARTETTKAVTTGNMESWRESGVVVGKEWILGSNHPEDDECDDNAAAGEIGLDEAFPSGDYETPAHPACECDVLPSA